MKKISDSDEYVQGLLLIEEEKSEKIANYWRIGMSFMFFGVTGSVGKEIPEFSVKVLTWGTTTYFMFSLFMFFFLRTGHYKPMLKYITVGVDIGITTTCMWAFGTYRTFKTEAFLLYYVWIALATMRLSTRLTLFSGFLSLASYITLVILALTFHTIETGSISESFTSSKVSMQNQFLRVLYMSVVIIAVTYGSRAYRNLASRAHKQERDAERQRMRAQRLESIGFLAGGIAHDFNNILAVISNNIHIARLHSRGNKKVTKKLDAAESATIKATNLTQQLLTFSKGGAPVKKAVPIHKIVKESVGFSLTGSSAKCEISALPPDIRAVKVDEGQINQVMNNLLINAIQASPPVATVNIEAANYTINENTALPLPPGDYVRLSVIDHGKGMSDDVIHKVFDPYFTTKLKGSGLGLATAYSIIKRHGGHITAESKPGKGSQFHIYLPATDEEYIQSEEPKPHTIPHSLRILIMDDEKDFLESASEALTLSGHSVAFATDGFEAIALYKQFMDTDEGFDLIIMDLTIPGGMGGVEAIRQLREVAPDVRAIVASGYSNDPVMSDHKNFGFNEILSKPFTMEQLQEAIHKALDTQQE